MKPGQLLFADGIRVIQLLYKIYNGMNIFFRQARLEMQLLFKICNLMVAGSPGLKLGETKLQFRSNAVVLGPLIKRDDVRLHELESVMVRE